MRPGDGRCRTTWYRDQAYYSVPWRGTWSSGGGGPAMGHGIHRGAVGDDGMTEALELAHRHGDHIAVAVAGSGGGTDAVRVPA
ncbi:hypothetical protein [Streptomyces yanii]|uniref:Uncharacterized protein n=1 Tax=Streptomyces yanii TaxID=78510 RepID=A0ABV5R4Z4_9ACTN